MALPKLETTIYNITLPVSKQEVKFRPFFVSEHKALLFASNDDDKKVLFRNLIELLEKCVQGEISIPNLSLSDFLFLFINIRARSVGEIMPLQFNYQVKGEKYVTPIIKMNLLEVGITNPTADPSSAVINIQGDIHLKMKQPPASLIFLLDDTEDNSAKILVECIECVTDGPKIINIKDESEDDIEAFFDGFSLKNKEDIKKFMESVPKLEHKIEYHCKQTNTDHTFSVGKPSDFLK